MFSLSLSLSLSLRFTPLSLFLSLPTQWTSEGAIQGVGQRDRDGGMTVGGGRGRAEMTAKGDERMKDRKRGTGEEEKRRKKRGVIN